MSLKLSVITLAMGAVALSSCANDKTQSAPASVPAATVAPAAAKPAQTTLAAEGRNPAEFPAYVEQLKQKARQQGISQKTLDSAFANVHFVDRAISLDQNQPENKITLDDYLRRVLVTSKIQQGQALAQQHAAELQKVSDRYAVQPQYVVALWGMESNYGKIQGKDDAFSALATLAFEGRREAFFTNELIAALTIVEQGKATSEMMKGSWAGAMGQTQFMPSSYLRYGADGDGDGKIDIWNNTSDVFASAANYLSSEGWKANQGWGMEVKLPAGFDTTQVGLKNDQAHSAAEWQQKGVLSLDGKPLPASVTRAWIITPDSDQGRAFMVYDNFRTIMHWNRSYYFAISVGMMADDIAGASVQ
ncbi:lytic murein transglycosylase [Rouxiella badensis]|jgi:membrane-bound lytic murein transglycosylase B|uniref:Lytic murein transglycosylase n=3 Tax=Rouxiella badensis TaxID=1646377 RepID=A0A1X0WBN3_9GAMM|nr:lytic murein transglycosylase [Rouxiella badensis]MCC3703601.1 lytic murein transglycosylase [Rouxiella badensis]MCC3719215.1 lytic murein transglycosylase [Rouxiella badensis]MCC3728465.1 lytic murein transglycosylase [Rouxiella badensis]MCC3742731.1 lytic murein transglycosylase [Rouxiella badensis]ORJ24123.1 lytic murein transglycosylase [Rouxiella badensis]